jgi:hypothetical protein
MVLADVVDFVQELPILMVVCLVVTMEKGTSFNVFMGNRHLFLYKIPLLPIYQCFTAGN